MQRANALASLGAGMFWQGAMDAAQANLQAALELYGDNGDPARRAFVLTPLGNLAIARNDLDRAQTLHEQCLALYRLAGDAKGIARASMSLGIVSFIGVISRGRRCC
jgi:hypothetical protein